MKCSMCGGGGPSPCCVGEFMMLSLPYRKVRGISIYRLPYRLAIGRLNPGPVKGIILPPDEFA